MDLLTRLENKKELVELLSAEMDKIIPVYEADCYQKWYKGNLEWVLIVDPVLFRKYYKKYKEYREPELIIEWLSKNVVKDHIKLIRI